MFAEVTAVVAASVFVAKGLLCTVVRTVAMAATVVRFGLRPIEMLQVCWRFATTRIVARKTASQGWEKTCMVDVAKNLSSKFLKVRS
jgi:hypothetical protein